MACGVSRMKEDRELQNEVQQRLQLTPDLHPADVGVSVQEGVVVLTGNVAAVSSSASGRPLRGNRLRV